MNTLKIFSILCFAIITFIFSFYLISKLLKYKSNQDNNVYSMFLHKSSLFIGLSIILNLVFQKVSYLYDLIDQYNLSFQKVFSIGKYQYGFSPEMVKVCIIYFALTIIWIVFVAIFSKQFSFKIFKEKNWENELVEAVIFLCLNIAFYPIISFILDNFYIVLDRPIIN